MQHSTGMRAARCAAPGPSSSALAARLACHASTSSRALAHVAPSVASVREASASQANSALVAPTATSHTSCRPAVHGEASSAPSSAARIENPYTALALVTAAATALALLLPPAGHCSESLSESSFAAFQSFLDYVETLGPAGPVVFVITVMLFEMVPLFPTQPLSIASGLLFGPVTGSLAVLLGVTLAANNAFLVSRGVGRQLAEKVIVMEMSEDQGHGAVAQKLAEVQHTIRTGGFWKQLTAVMLLRLTPVVPFSASNYVLGLTPVQLPAYLGGTVIGMSMWSILYASLGAASRQLLDGGMDMGTLFADLAERASRYSSVALSISAGGAVLAAVVYAASRALTSSDAGQGDVAATSTSSQPADGSIKEQSMLQPAERVHK